MTYQHTAVWLAPLLAWATFLCTLDLGEELHAARYIDGYSVIFFLIGGIFLGAVVGAAVLYPVFR